MKITRKTWVGVNIAFFVRESFFLFFGRNSYQNESKMESKSMPKRSKNGCKNEIGARSEKSSEKVGQN